MADQEDRYIIPSVVRALRILESFSLRKSTYTNAELSRKLDINKSSLTRLLSSLEKAKFVERNTRTGEYRLTHKAYQVGRVYIRQVDYHTASMPILKELTARCGEASHLGILDEMKVLYLDWVESKHPVSLASITGEKLPAYCTGIGKLFLAHMDEDTISSYLNKIEMIRFTPNTITSPEELKMQLAQVQSQGYAMDSAEYQPDVISVSAPVRNDTGDLVAGISVAGPDFRMSDEVLTDVIIPQILRASRQISARLGCDLEPRLTAIGQ
jgi:DNA-binding IclR family transcriptional regulator